MTSRHATGIRLGNLILTACATLVCIGGWAQTGPGRGGVVDTLCSAMPDAQSAAQDFAEMFAAGTDDLDSDGLPDHASLALMREVACNPNAPASLATSTGTAYAANLAFFDGEADTAGLEGFREAIAVLMATNATTEAAVKSVLAALAPPVTLAADYTQVTCASGTCMPVPARANADSGEFLDFATPPRAANEPYAADGDLDGDTHTNLTEYNNIQAQAGELDDFVVAATSANLNGTEPVRSSGGGCFIATAAYGTPLAGQIGVLRAYRDDALLTNPAGAAAADAYYRLSPPIAQRVAASGALAGVVRTLLTPAIAVTSGGTTVLWIVLMLGSAGLLGASIVLRRVTFPGRRPRRARGR